jgi:hypothetical protein
MAVAVADHHKIVVVAQCILAPEALVVAGMGRPIKQVVLPFQAKMVPLIQVVVAAHKPTLQEVAA